MGDTIAPVTLCALAGAWCNGKALADNPAFADYLMSREADSVKAPGALDNEPQRCLRTVMQTATREVADDAKAIWRISLRITPRHRNTTSGRTRTSTETPHF